MAAAVNRQASTKHAASNTDECERVPSNGTPELLKPLYLHNHGGWSL